MPMHGALAPFARGLFALADAHHCELVGGDTLRGPRNICITRDGRGPGSTRPQPGTAAFGRNPGDDIYVSGTLGGRPAGAGVPAGSPDADHHGQLANARRRLETPEPRVALGQALRGVAQRRHRHQRRPARRSGAYPARLRRGSPIGVRPGIDAAGPWPHPTDAPLAEATRLRCVLAGGDDYELAFTAPAAARAAVAAAAKDSATTVTRVGQIEATPGLRLHDAQGRDLPDTFQSFDHFA